MPLTTTRICDPKFYTPELPTLSPGCPCRTSRCLFAALWSVFPLLIQDSACRIENIDDIVVALGHRDRGSSNPRCSSLPGPRLENVSVTTQERFPKLTQPDSILGGICTTPARLLWLPNLRKLLLLDAHLVSHFRVHFTPRDDSRFLLTSESGTGGRPRPLWCTVCSLVSRDACTVFSLFPIQPQVELRN